MPEIKQSGKKERRARSVKERINRKDGAKLMEGLLAHYFSRHMKRNRKQSKSPTQRSLAHLRKEGWTVAIVEKFNPYIKIRQDLWGFGDLLCFHPLRGIDMIVQTTTSANLAGRVQKVRENATAVLWLLSAHHRIEVHGWAKRFERGKKRPKYELRKVELR